VLDCARNLAEIFAKYLAEFGDTTGHSPTLSVGIVIAHHLEPLSDALALARMTERVAKAVEGKNALAITLDKRGGATKSVAGTWGSLDIRMAKFVQWHIHDDIPDGAAYELRELASSLSTGDTADADDRRILGEAMKHETRRVLKRKRASHGKEKMSDAVLKELRVMLDNPGADIGSLAEELIIARVFSDAHNLTRREA